MKIFRLHTILFFLLCSFNAAAATYFIDGYVVVENLYVPVENQIVEIRNEGGEIVASALTDASGYYSNEIELPVSATSLTLSMSRSCGGEVQFYNYEVQLSNPHLGYTFLVCEDLGCEARFNYEQQARNQLIFEFTSISEGNIDSYFWNFGDGNTSTEQNPVHEYDFPDIYIVSLTINGRNCSDADARNVDVDYRDCLAKYSFNQVNQGQQLVVEFKNLSQGYSLQYYWEFSSGGYSYLENPTHAFDAPGVYGVTLHAARQGCNHILEKYVRVAPLPGCYALFQSEQVFSADLSIGFTNLSVGKDILHWVWLFGDGGTSTEQNPSHIYTEPGTYEVLLRVISASGQSNYTHNVQVVESSGCLADFGFTQNNPDNPQINFNSLTANGDLQFSWDFGDGDGSLEKSPAHQYDDFGTYQVSLSVLGYGCTDSVSHTVIIEEPIYCDAKFTTRQDFPQSREIGFIDQSYGDDIVYLWDFGDGFSSDHANPIHIYQYPGQYEVKLLIHTSQNCIDSAFANVQILPPLSISGNVFAGDVPLGIGSVWLYRLSDLQHVEFIESYLLDEGFFTFEDLEPGSYFVQAIPDLDFPFPVIPFYYPHYSGGVTQWQEAEVLHTDAIPQIVNIYLGSYNDFFNGKASLSGKIIQADADILPLTIYLTNDFGEIYQSQIPDDQLQFNFADIPYGSYKIRPEKSGKISESFDLTLDEDMPTLNNILFLETSLSIIPDLSLIDDDKRKRFVMYPNPANDFLKIQYTDVPSLSSLRIRIFSAALMEVLITETFISDPLISLAGLADGFYIVEIFDGQNYNFQKLLVKH